jgi:succinylglutamate desuccinylase
VDRVLGSVRGSLPGPTLLAVAGLHGNEPAGVLALQRVVRALNGRDSSVRGEFAALAGNRTALLQGRRFIDHDLNRAWRASGGGELEAEDPDRTEPASETIERSELKAIIEEIVTRARGPVYFLDLHTSSGPARPFSTVMDSLASRKFAMGISVPLVVGLGEQVEGTLLGHLADRGIPGMVFEGGQHNDAYSVDASEAGVWLALAAAGVLPEAGTPELERARRLLVTATLGLPPVMELSFRHPVTEKDGFRMHAGYRSFQLVSAGQVVAEDRTGPIEVPEDGRLLMPLYQSQGEDGFFLVREFHPFWLNVSEVLRRLRVARTLHWFPGIRKDPESADRLQVDKRLARWFTMEVLHLLGYRRSLTRGDWLVVIRQREPTKTS